MSKQQQQYITIKEGQIHFGFHWLRRQEGEYFSCYIPAYDMYFSSPADFSQAERRAKIMVKSFFNYYMKKEAPKNLFLAIHSLGFRTNNHTYTMKRLLNRERIDTKFLVDDAGLPESFEGAEATAIQGELAY